MTVTPEAKLPTTVDDLYDKLTSAEHSTGTILIEIFKSIVASPYMWITFLSVTIATLFPRALSRIQGAPELGGYLLYLFLFCIGLPTDFLHVVTRVPQMFGLCIVINAVNIAVLLITGYFLRLNLEDLLLASNATI